MAKKYEFLADAHNGTIKIRNLDAQVVGAELSKLESQKGGLTSRAVVAHARPKNNPLHNCFEWDDTIAGEEYRNLQAQYLIRVVRVVEQNDEGLDVPVRAFIHVSNGEGPRYIKAAKVMADAHLRELAIKEAQQYLERAKSKLADFRELESIYKLVDRAGKKLSKVA